MSHLKGSGTYMDQGKELARNRKGKTVERQRRWRLFAQ
jgi:hypothetical protein